MGQEVCGELPEGELRTRLEEGSYGSCSLEADVGLPSLPARLGHLGKRGLDIVTASLLLLLLLPVIVVVAATIKLESPGPVIYRCRRVGYGGREFLMLKFRKMHHSAAGLALTLSRDARFTRVGSVLARTKLDELPQLWNVLRGEMSLVGPRPEDPYFVALRRPDFEPILRVKPGITGLSQLAFAEESRLLDPDHRVEYYLERLLPQKTAIDQLYASRRSFSMDLRILAWTCTAVLFRRDVAVHRSSGRLNLRRRPPVAVAVPAEIEAVALAVKPES